MLINLVMLISMGTSYLLHILRGIPSKSGQGDYAIATPDTLLGPNIFIVLDFRNTQKARSGSEGHALSLLQSNHVRC